jgi:hypothetical protein
MRRPGIVLLAGLIMTLSAISVYAVDISGYDELQFMPVSLSSEYSQLFSNKLRVDLQSDDVDHVKFAANFDYLTYRGRTDWNLLDYLPNNVTAMIPAGYDSLFNFTYDDTIFLDNAFVKFSESIFDITVGKQQISPGTGYAWNPTDLFNNKDIIDPTYEQPGHSAIRVDATLAARYTAIAMYFPENDWESSGKLFRFKGGLGHFDYSVIYTEKYWQLSDFLSYQNISAQRHLYGGDFAGQLLGLGVWGEFGYNTFKGHEDFGEYLVGTDYTFDNGLYLMGEYLYSGLGKSDPNQYNLNDWVRYYLAESRALSRDNLYIYGDYPVNDLIHVANSFIISLSDRSVSLIPSLQYSLYQNIDLTVFFNVNTGGKKTAYSTAQGYSGICRLKVYF